MQTLESRNSGRRRATTLRPLPLNSSFGDLSLLSFRPLCARAGQWLSSIRRVRPYTGRIASATFSGSAAMSLALSSRESVTPLQPSARSVRIASPFMTGTPSPAMASRQSRAICPGLERQTGRSRSMAKRPSSVSSSHCAGKTTRVPSGSASSARESADARQSSGTK